MKTLRIKLAEWLMGVVWDLFPEGSGQREMYEELYNEYFFEEVRVK